MDSKIASIMMQMLAGALGTKEQCCASDFVDVDFGALYSLSKSHDLAHIIGAALPKSGIEIPKEYEEKFQKQQKLATYRCLGMQIEMERIDNALENAKIPYMPLKGTVIRPYYPAPEMRTSSDIDILVHEDNLEKAVCVFRDVLGYQVGLKSTHDISLFSPSGVHVELHFSLSEDDPKLDEVLLTAWDSAVRESDRQYRYRMSNEMFFVYCVSHMAKHFVGGGCGIRPFIDLHIIKTKMAFDEEKANLLLKECSLTVFAKEALNLCNVWFGNADHTQMTREMHSYILNGGVYGKKTSKVAIATVKKGKLKYFLSRVFLSYDILKLYYTRLEKYPVLYPYYTVVRWFRVLFGKNRKSAVAELKQSASSIDKSALEMAELCQKLELI